MARSVVSFTIRVSNTAKYNCFRIVRITTSKGSTCQSVLEIQEASRRQETKETRSQTHTCHGDRVKASYRFVFMTNGERAELNLMAHGRTNIVFYITITISK